MVEGLIGRKIGMTQIFDDQGSVIPVTMIKAGPCTVIQKKSLDKDGYSAVQMGLVEESNPNKANKPTLGHFKQADVPPVRILREFRIDEKEDIKPGDQVFVDMFKAGEKVDVVGTSKGKGFAGVIKRWGFHGGRKTHGSMFHRRPGSVGCSAYPSRVFKGKKLPGQMGNQRVAVKNLMVVQTDKDKSLLLIKGAVPGANNGYLMIKKTDFHSGLPDKTKKE